MNDQSDGEPSIYETLPGGPELLRWFGRVPTFHDAEILSLTLNRRGESLLRLHVWLLLSGQGPEARLELAKPAVVTFILKEIMDLRLEGFSPQNVIYGLVLRRAPDPYGRLASDPRQDCVEIELRDCYGLSGRLLARSVGVAFRPGDPTAEDLQIRRGQGSAPSPGLSPPPARPAKPPAEPLAREAVLTSTLTLRRPDDWHLHLRDGAMLEGVLPESRHFARAIVMPNLVPPVATADQARAYRGRIAAATPAGQDFTPLMTLYLTEATDPADVAAAAAEGLVTAVKLYPAGATTNSASGVRDLAKVMPVLEKMAEIGLPLCVHGEVTDPAIDIFDREAAFLDRVLDPLRRRLPELRVILEHVTTADGVDYVRGAENLGATLTVHHLILDRNAMLVGGMRPHYYCLPILKRARHRQALRAAAVSGDPRFFNGTDSAPHARHAKEAECCAAGVFSAPVALACLAHVFEEEGALDRLEAFASLNGPAFYGLAPNAGRITLEKADAPLSRPAQIETGAGPVAVFDPGFPLLWRVRDEEPRP